MSLVKLLDKARLKDKAPQSIKRLKLRTMTHPTDADAWFELSLYMFDLEDNKSGWKCLTNAKKLGSVQAIVKIKEIIQAYDTNSKALEHFTA
jgi:hypothetical protein